MFLKCESMMFLIFASMASSGINKQLLVPMTLPKCCCEVRNSYLMDFLPQKLQYLKSPLFSLPQCMHKTISPSFLITGFQIWTSIPLPNPFWLVKTSQLKYKLKEALLISSQIHCFRIRFCLSWTKNTIILTSRRNPKY